jgi:hypothetical protein
MRTKRHTPAQVYYPESDGKPMAETDVHRDWMFRIIELLKFFFAEWLKPALQGYRLVDGNYVLLEPGEDGGLVSEQLGITFRLEDGDLALLDTRKGKRLQLAAEQRAQELEEELARLRAERNS